MVAKARAAIFLKAAKVADGVKAADGAVVMDMAGTAAKRTVNDAVKAVVIMAVKGGDASGCSTLLNCNCFCSA